MKQVLTRYIIEENESLGYGMINIGISLEDIEDRCDIISVDHDKTYVHGTWYITAVILFTAKDEDDD